MKTFPRYFAAIVLALALLVGCASDPSTAAIRSDAVVIQGVDGAMTAWAARVNAGQATRAQVNTVSNAYYLYWNSQIVASNTAYLYTLNPSPTIATAVSTAAASALASQTNLVAIVNQLLK